MRDILSSPFTIGVCLLVLLAWVLMVVAIFWPQKPDGAERDDDHVCF
jgi:hypothetical protein